MCVWGSGEAVCVWELTLYFCRDIPVDMKYVAEPAMHSMPSVTVHPTGKPVTTPSPYPPNHVQENGWAVRVWTTRSWYLVSTITSDSIGRRPSEDTWSLVMHVNLTSLQMERKLIMTCYLSLSLVLFLMTVNFLSALVHCASVAGFLG